MAQQHQDSGRTGARGGGRRARTILVAAVVVVLAGAVLLALRLAEGPAPVAGRRAAPTAGVATADVATADERPSQAGVQPGFSGTITSPAEGTPEAVVQTMLRAGLAEDEAAGWERLAALLHSEVGTAEGLDGWRRYQYAVLRRSVRLYVTDPEAVSFDVARVEGRPDGGVRFFLRSGAHELPRPCELAPDPRSGGAWRVKRCTLDR